ncbi:MAG TPA: 1-deoxy-D-xylulose-5-phosphate reductoisomerase [Candidatus Angelobacter sp.]|jgi:1-deoxy-D-xylulose-5-phosphate reductoisomerase|nr:1-deoxy-D-xylulose-5-phosphate reductoisomerase [Candidatus Angelobacter sp.]
MKRISILGSTGSIGRSTLDVIEKNPQRFKLVTMAAGSNVELALEQARRWQPKVLSLASEQDAEKTGKQLKAEGLNDIQIVFGQAGTVRVATHAEVDFVVSAIVGVAGLKATYEAVRAGKEIGLANKECMVAAGELITREARKQGKPLLPIDSEHNAVHQCMRGGRMHEVERVWLTASGGPFLNTPKSAFERITVEQALNHPTWKMGKRITIDSATLMNKGFEVIEACRLFDMPPEKVSVIVHPQSTIHSMVEFNDGSILAQLSVTDMRLPIFYALTYPERIASDLRFNVLDLKRLDFAPPDPAKFPCLRLAYEAAEAGGAKTIALNAADEVAVAGFLNREIGFADIPKVIEHTILETSARHPESIEEVLAIDAQAREAARRRLQGQLTR